MSLEAFEKLDELISTYVLEIQKIKAENRRLFGQVKSLSEELDDMQSRQTRLKSEVDDLTALKTANRKMELDREKVRRMVRGILTDLDKFDLV